MPFKIYINSVKMRFGFLAKKKALLLYQPRLLLHAGPFQQTTSLPGRQTWTKT